MQLLKIIAWTIISLYAIVIFLLYTLQTRLIFYPGKLAANYRFKKDHNAQEVVLTAADGTRISGLYFPNRGPDVILYFHGNAGDLSGWQFVAEDFVRFDFNVMMIDYRGYGKSSGRISEKGLYHDADAAYQFVIDKGFTPENIIVYGRSIGSGVAVNLASEKPSKGLILESPFSSFPTLANEKLPLLFPSLYLQYRFDNAGKINHVKCPVIFLHGSDDTLIPSSHSKKLFKKFQGKKKLIVIERGAHNDLHAFSQYEDFLRDMPAFF